MTPRRRIRRDGKTGKNVVLLNCGGREDGGAVIGAGGGAIGGIPECAVLERGVPVVAEIVHIWF